MPRKISKPSPSRPRWIWGVCGAFVLAALSAGGWSFWRATAPPPPIVNTTGFDPMIVQAIQEARQAVLRSPRSADARGRLGMVLLAHELRPDAAKCFAQASVFAPREPRWFYLLGFAQLMDNSLAASTNLDRAVRLFGARELAPRLKLADTLLGLGRVDEAERQYQEVLKLDAKCAAAQLGLGKVENARGHAEKAAAYFAAVLRDPTTRKASHRLLLNVYQRSGRTNEAEQISRALAPLPDDQPFPDPLLAEVERLKTGEGAWTDLGDEWIKAGRVTDALPLLEKTVRTYPKSDRALFLLGRALLRLGDAKGAEAALLRAIALAPGSIEAQMQLGVARLRQGRAKEAQPCFLAAIQAKPNLGEGWYNLGLSLGEDPTKRAESMAAFREAIRLKPNLLESYLGLAVVLRAQGQKQAAAQELRRALALQPEEPLRGRLLEQLRLAEQP